MLHNIKPYNCQNKCVSVAALKTGTRDKFTPMNMKSFPISLAGKQFALEKLYKKSRIATDTLLSLRTVVS